MGQSVTVTAPGADGCGSNSDYEWWGVSVTSTTFAHWTEADGEHYAPWWSWFALTDVDQTLRTSVRFDTSGVTPSERSTEVPLPMPAGTYTIAVECHGYNGGVSVIYPAVEVRVGEAPTGTVNGAQTATAVAGGVLSVAGRGFVPGEGVKATLHSEPVELGTFPAGADGAVSFQARIPQGFEVGAHTVVLTGLTSGRTVTLNLQVEAGSAAAAGTAGAAAGRTAGAQLPSAALG
ncbi:hypothetical protein ET495_12300 [Xylanimonas allomyrinae]|uniref:Uncharacterized protein n=1 Tax=Xylanimonas allomyrinae TaxID=2509459 RepID=A0A4P6EN39_9MICO|nr:hypothetical protein [Xylanimonas allomyrinae]QAY63885.1 hypothetical protein ET495_12300 [Xylanimonas allomyrinae]